MIVLINLFIWAVINATFITTWRVGSNLYPCSGSSVLTTGLPGMALNVLL